MASFSNDVDLVKREPVLFRALWLAGQTLCRGLDGVVAGGVLTSASVSFTSCSVAPGQVVVLTYGTDLDGCYEVVSVESEHSVRISVVRPSADDPAVAPGDGAAVQFRISTFEPQACEAAQSLLAYLGLTGTDADADVSVVDKRALRAAAVYAVLTAVFAAHATGEDDVSGYWKKAEHYQRMLETVRPRIRTAVDRDGDGVSDGVVTANSIELRRL